MLRIIVKNALSEIYGIVFTKSFLSLTYMSNIYFGIRNKNINAMKDSSNLDPKNIPITIEYFTVPPPIDLNH